MKSRIRVLATIILNLALSMLGAAATNAQTPVRAGEELKYQVATPPVYPRGGPDRPATWKRTITSRGAMFLRIHFRKLNLPAGDYVTVSSPDRGEVWTYAGRGPGGTGNFWTFAVQGDTVLVELHGGPAGQARGHGLAIDRITHGTLPLYEESSLPQELEKVVCGTDDRENVACHPNFVNPVARLLYQKGGGSYVCTGWLIAGSNANTMITNNHCVANQTEVSTVQALFNYRTVSCAGGSLAPTSSYTGGTFLRTHAGLDYTLFTLQGNPEPFWGEYTATNKTPSVGMVMILPQHPGGTLKKTGYWNNSSHTSRCTVATANASYSGATLSSQMGYSCDTEGGSSGSPVIEAATGRAIGLHHFGGVSGSPCLNSATQMKNICSDAGSLLRCGSSSSCVPAGGVDDTHRETYCCTGVAVYGSTVCLDPADYNDGWESCSHICGTAPVNGCIPSGGIASTNSSPSCCSGQAVPGSTWCLDPADYGDDWTSCVHVCQSACGDGLCESGESIFNCPNDCGTCGNYVCDPGEDSFSCLNDCPICGDSVCSPGEDSFSCLNDCPICGDSVCGPGEDSFSCPDDCGGGAICGNFVCEPGEDPFNCSPDCCVPGECQ